VLRKLPGNARVRTGFSGGYNRYDRQALAAARRPAIDLAKRQALAFAPEVRR